MAFEWFRSWHGAPTDAKYRVIARRAGVAPGMVSAVYWAVLDYASQNKPRGSVEGFDTETYAEWAGWEESDVQAIITAFVVKETILDGMIASWDKRQPKREDDSAVRVAAFRERNRVTSDDVTQSNAVKRNVNDRLDKTRKEKTREDETRKDEETGTDPEFAAAVKAWEGMGLLVNPTIKIEIGEAVDYWRIKGHPEFVADAIRIAAKANVRRWDYVQGILRRCEANGTAPGAENKANGKTSTKAPAKTAAAAQTYEELKAAYVPAGWEDIIEH